ncbi:hypothetical protein LTR56_018547 [Elasticomyces elasticus]|nr:hypothetical protein LTR56_018547 [Elasticomyces elasticus]KAK3660240.1 hypothetical protein LTR22_008065 [Elasticomyces elasticus]KAK4933688.1 hypothetical protein LTR49_000153 [Elasticomyces elasticus]KAK5761621.1 hypothetical protein LTS12_008225 [Elasticomyces elasticus]
MPDSWDEPLHFLPRAMASSVEEETVDNEPPHSLANTITSSGPDQEEAQMLCNDNSHDNASDPSREYLERKFCRHPKLEYPLANGTLAMVHERSLNCIHCPRDSDVCSAGAAATPMSSTQYTEMALARPSSPEKALFERVLQGAFDATRRSVQSACDRWSATPGSSSALVSAGTRVQIREEDDWNLVDLTERDQ